MELRFPEGVYRPLVSGTEAVIPVWILRGQVRLEIPTGRTVCLSGVTNKLGRCRHLQITDLPVADRHSSVAGRYQR